MKPTICFATAAGSVDAASGTIRGVSLITEGPALGHGVQVDRTTLEQVKIAAEQYEGGLKVKLDHNSGAGDIVGFIDNLRIDGAKLLGDLHLLQNSPHRAYILEIAEKIPDTFGLSIAFSGPSEMSADKKTVLQRCSEIYSVDIVSEPAANPSAVPTPGSPDNKRLVILDRRQRLLRVLENGKELRRYPVAVGMPGWETPVGSFTVIEKTANPTWEHPASGQLLPPGPENPLGSRWIGFYRDCQGRSGFNGQEHLVLKGCVTAGFHGTPNRSSVGRAVSHGCVRLFDEHAWDLFDLVSLGTPVTVLP